MSMALHTRVEMPPETPSFEARVFPQLDSSQIRYYARYFGDPLSRLFWQNEELWMGILPPHGQAFARMWDLPIMRSLVDERLLVGLEPAPQKIPGFDAVYRLADTPRITYWHEWSPKMLRAAALRLIVLLQRLAQHQLTLRNPHPWNLLYDGLSFIYVNPGSILPLDAETFARSYEKLARFFVRPLLLIEKGLMHVARRLAEDPREGVLAEDLQHMEKAWAAWKPESGANQILPFLEQLETEVASLTCNSAGERWIDYFATDCDFGPGTSWSRKQHALEAILDDTQIKSVLDLGANTGHYARIAASRGREVIAADFDPALVDAAFEEARRTALFVYPVVADFAHPTPGQGVDGSWFPPATERWKADLVLCFAVSHHMVFGKYRLDFEQVALGIRGFARQWALVEYVERGKIRPAEWRPDSDKWYTVEHLAAALRRRFPAVQVLPPAKDGRRLLVCGPERRLV
jgi:SAM-dependent methyltransferase